MHASFITQIKAHPLLFALSVGLHLLLVLALTINLANPTAPKMPPSKDVETVKAVIIDARVVEIEKQKLIRAEQNKRNKQIAQKNKLDRDAKKARDKRIKEEKRLAKIRSKEKKLKKEASIRKKLLAKKDKAEREKKQQELAKLEQQKRRLQQQQKELEQKRQDEQQKLAAIESKRKLEEARRKAAEVAALKKQRQKKLAAQAEVRRRAQQAEMHRQMLEEEKRLAKQSKQNQKLLAQYIYQIQRKVEFNWNAPASMTAGWSCEIMVEQNRFGEVQTVQTKQCTGSEAFKSTVERAVRKASPLPEAPNNDIYEKKLSFIFSPKV